MHLKHVSFGVDVAVGCRTGGAHVEVTEGLSHVQVLVDSTGELGLLVGLLVARVST